VRSPAIERSTLFSCSIARHASRDDARAIDHGAARAVRWPHAIAFFSRFSRLTCAIIAAMNAQRFSFTVASLAALLAGATGCVEASVYEKTAGQLDVAGRAIQQKDQQIRTLEWQVVMLSQQLREAQLRGEASQRELGAQVAQLGAQNAALTERVKAAEEARERLATFLAADDGKAPGGKSRPDELRRLAAALDAQNAKLIERIGRLEQKIDARAAEDRSQPKPPRPDRNVEGDVVDPWGFGARK
jgi:septal ring factor EnvC (AmiA/AmiB activator)